MDYFYKSINNLYEKKGFLEKYGGSLVMTIIIILVFFVLVSYFFIISKIETIKQDWPNQRCKPSVIPFAGIINAPDGQDKQEYTNQNFNQCMNDTLEGVADTAMQPVYYSLSVIQEVANGIMDAINSMREMFDKLRNDIAAFGQEVYARSLNFLMPILLLFIKLKDSFNKVNGVMGVAVFSLLGAYDTLRSLFNSVAEMTLVIILFLMVLIIIGYSLMSNPFTIVPGIMMVIINLIPFLILTTILILISIYMSDLMQLSFPGIPGPPSCFGKNVKVRMKNGYYKSISTIKVGDVLFYDGKVNSVMKLRAENEKLYKYNNIIVSGLHRFYKNNCLVPEKNTITIDNIVFTDWFDLDKSERMQVEKIAKVNNCNSKDFIKDFFLGGFEGETKVELTDGHTVDIKDLVPGDTLRYGEIVQGIVKISAHSFNICETIMNDTKFIGKNIHTINKNLGIISSRNYENVNCGNSKYIYHIITDKQVFHIDGNVLLDFNSCVDLYLEDEQEKIYKNLLSRDLL
jgi:predicted PurR-regulated permease PerM